MKFKSTKTFGHNLGLSCAFRQWKASHSHCSLIHGYALEVTLEFEADELDNRNWVMDFGGLKAIKKKLEYYFDHTTIIAEDDPELEYFNRGAAMGVLDVRVLPAVGCEQFSLFIFKMVSEWLYEKGHSDRVTLTRVSVREPWRKQR